MKITAVEAYLLSYPLPEPFPKRDAMLVRVSTDEGLVGYAPGEPTQSSKQIIDRVIAPFLRGRTLADPDALRVLFQQGPGADAEASRIYAAVEVALYDLVGKAHDLPISELIGGRVRDRIRLYGSATKLLSADEYVGEALRVRSLGFRGYKMRAQGSADDDIAAVRAVREAAGPDFDIMVDAHAWNYSAEAVERFANELVEQGIRWLEEPVDSADHAAYAHLKSMHIVPLASGRHEPSELRFLDLIESAAVDYVQMDLISQGSYAIARRVFGDIARAGMRFAFHTQGTALDLIAAAQLGVCWPESVVRWLEYPCYFDGSFPLAGEIVKQPVTIERGELIVPRTPGIGVEIDETVIWRYPWIASPKETVTMTS
jgi:L-alanine-DL-glutamate epimerase-like enolase superfamily enzyme